MTTKIITIFKYITIAFIATLSFTSCESDFENVGGDLVDNGVFDTKKIDLDLIAYTKNIDASRVDNIESFKITSLKMPLGIYNTADFGLLKSSLITQVSLPSGLDWADNPNLDAVYLEIPYDATSVREAGDTKPKFELNNILGDQDVTYQVRVMRLGTFLSRLDPADPSKAKKYYSDKVYTLEEELYPWTDFKPSINDTVAYYDRTMLDTAVNGYAEIQVQDTIKHTDNNPFIRFPLDKNFFIDNFIGGNQANFENNNDFQSFFKGIVIEVAGSDGSIMMLDTSLGNLNLYYTNTVTKTEVETDVDKDLDGDGDIDNTSVTYDERTKKTATFSLGGIRTNHFDRDYSSANGNTQITTPNMVDGEKKLYVQGAAGSIAVIDLFNGVDITALRNRNLLINEANLTFYIDNQNDNDIPNRLLLFKLDADGTNPDTQVLDAITENTFFNGYLQKDGDNPTKYKVNITDYISEILKKEDFTTPSKLGLKIYNGLDTPSTVNDTIVTDHSWNPKGVVLYGNKYLETDVDYSKRLKLEIYYTELNN